MQNAWNLVSFAKALLNYAGSITIPWSRELLFLVSEKESSHNVKSIVDSGAVRIEIKEC